MDNTSLSKIHVTCQYLVKLPLSCKSSPHFIRLFSPRTSTSTTIYKLSATSSDTNVGSHSLLAQKILFGLFTITILTNPQFSISTQQPQFNPIHSRFWLKHIGTPEKESFTIPCNPPITTIKTPTWLVCTYRYFCTLEPKVHSLEQSSWPMTHPFDSLSYKRICFPP